jgi:hypothetical protein
MSFALRAVSVNARIRIGVARNGLGLPLGYNGLLQNQGPLQNGTGSGRRKAGSSLRTRVIDVDRKLHNLL